MDARSLTYESKVDAPPPRGWAALGELLRLAGPTIVQMASYTVMQFLDTWMLSLLGTVEPTAAGNASLFSWSFIGFGVGVLFCVNTLVSQSFGQKDYAACGRYMWQGVWFGVMFAAVALPVIPFARPLFQALGHEPRLAGLEAQFFSITVAAAVIKLSAVSFGQFLLAINRPWMVLAAAVCGVSANAIVNCFLVLGWYGAPKLSVAGAAIGTNVGVTVELLVLAAIALRARTRAEFNTLDWRPRRAPLLTLLKIGLPSGGQVVADVLAWTLFTVWVMAPFGTEAMAANNFVFRYLSVSFMPAFGISTAVTALVGRYIGAGDFETARHRAHLGFWVAMVYMVSCGAAYVIWRNELIMLFSREPAVLAVGATLLVFAGLYQLFDALYIIYNGALRGAGDTMVPFLTTAGLCWTITVLGGWAVSRYWPGLGPAGPWWAATLYGAVLGAFMFARFVRGKWATIRLESVGRGDKVRGFAEVGGMQ
ncbi:MAG: MATE family efflux transporter [Phycisphaerae bacterium]|nr:MATE family efflux transporter [Tepidisphaeraceae bacterium]